MDDLKTVSLFSEISVMLLNHFNNYKVNVFRMIIVARWLFLSQTRLEGEAMDPEDDARPWLWGHL